MGDSHTKRAVPVDELRTVTSSAFGPDAELAGWQELTEGTFNSAYSLELADGRRAVLKVAPPPGLRLLRYEVDLMRTEAEFFTRAAGAGVPVPAVYHSDPDGGYLVMEWLTGAPLYRAGPMPDAARAALHHELGSLAARLGGVTAERFGYPRRDGRTDAARWSESFLAMVDDVLADGVALGTRLPLPADEIARLARRYARLLDEVTTPALVHFDLWDGNVFVRTDGTGGYRVEGLIDGERAFYGDPIAELVSMALLRDPADVPGLLPGFLGRELTAAERTRWRLYSVYLYLIMLTEMVTRGQDPDNPDAVRVLTAERLTALLADLAG